MRAARAQLAEDRGFPGARGQRFRTALAPGGGPFLGRAATGHDPATCPVGGPGGAGVLSHPFPGDSSPFCLYLRSPTLSGPRASQSGVRATA